MQAPPARVDLSPTQAGARLAGSELPISPNKRWPNHKGKRSERHLNAGDLRSRSHRRIKAGTRRPTDRGLIRFDGPYPGLFGHASEQRTALVTSILGPDEFVAQCATCAGGPLGTNQPSKDLMLQGLRGWVGRTDDELLETGANNVRPGNRRCTVSWTWRRCAPPKQGPP